MNQDSSENITDDIIEVASTFKFKYGSISLFNCGLVSRDYNRHLIECILTRLMIFKKMLLVAYYFYLSRQTWTLLNENPYLFHLYNSHLVENGNLKLAKSIFRLIENFDNVKHNNHIQFNKSYKMIVFLN